MSQTQMESGSPTCGARKYDCVCYLPKGHEGRYHTGTPSGEPGGPETDWAVDYEAWMRETKVVA